MPRDLTPLDHSPSDLDALAELTPGDFDAARVWAGRHLPKPYASALDAQEDATPAPAPPAR